MTVGIIEATTGALGEELTMLGGFVSTRLTTQTTPETQLQSGLLTMDYDGALTVTLTAGTFLLTVANGHRLRILSGPDAGAEALIDTRDSGIQCTLQGPLPFTAAFVGESWEIVEDADDSILVESTLGFGTAPGRLVIDGQVYNYSGTTISSFTGITHDDGTGLIVRGVAQAHRPLSVVADWSRSTSAIDQYRRGFLVAYAVLSDLDIIGKNLGVPRPPELEDDEVYRRLIQALAYAPRGTIFAMEQVLDVLLGEAIIATGTETASGTGDPFLVDLSSGSFPVGCEGLRFRVTSGYLTGRTVHIEERVSATQIRLELPMEEDFTLESWEITDPNWEIFEDLTLGSVNHGCKVFFRRRDNTAEDPNGKTFLDGHQLIPLASTTTLLLPAAGRLRVAGMKLKDEGGWSTIATGRGAASTDDGETITGPAASFPARILVGDVFQIMDGVHAGLKAPIVSRDSAVQLTLGISPGVSNISPTPTGILGVNFNGIGWQVLRERTNCRLYRPSADIRIEHPADAGTTIWDYVGTNETLNVTSVNGILHGRTLLIEPQTEEVVYRHPLRITPEARGQVEIHFDVFGAMGDAVGDGRQCALMMADGERVLAFGLIDEPGNLMTRLGFISMVSGEFIGTTPKPIWSNVVDTKFSPGMNTVRLVKTGRGTVRLYRQAWQGAFTTTHWELIDEIDYADFDTVGDWQAAAGYVSLDHEIAWGCFDTGFSHEQHVKYIDWQVENVVDFWNLRRTGQATNTSEQISDASNPFVVGDIGKTVRISDFSALNPGGGNSLGSWLVTARPSAALVTLTGETKYRGRFSLQNVQWLSVRDDPEVFVWPDHRGHSVEILDGPNAGVYPILAIVDPVTGRSVEEPVLTASAAGAGALQIISTDDSDGSFVVGVGQPKGPRVRVAGLVGGVATVVTLDLVPGAPTVIGTNFDAGTVLSMDLVQTSSGGESSEATFSGTIRLQNVAAGTTVLDIAPGRTSFGRPRTVAAAATWLSAELQATKIRSNIVLLDTPGFTITDAECSWRIVPVFPADAAVSYELVDAGTDAAGTLTLREAAPFPVGTVMDVHVSTVLSAYVYEERQENELTPPSTYSMHPFYLYDGFGFVRGVLDILTVAGVIPDFDNLVVDASGYHILED